VSPSFFQTLRPPLQAGVPLIAACSPFSTSWQTFPYPAEIGCGDFPSFYSETLGCSSAPLLYNFSLSMELLPLSHTLIRVTPPFPLFFPLFFSAVMCTVGRARGPSPYTASLFEVGLTNLWQAPIFFLALPGRFFLR